MWITRTLTWLMRGDLTRPGTHLAAPVCGRACGFAVHRSRRRLARVTGLSLADRGERIDDAGVHLIRRQPARRVEQPGWLRQPPEVHELACEQARELLGPLLDEAQRFLREDVVGLQLIGVPDAIAQIDGRGSEDVFTPRQPARPPGHRGVAFPD